MFTGFVGSGGTLSDHTVSKHHELEILSGGTADGTTVLSGGTIVVSHGGLASGTTVSSGGQEIVRRGGIASGNTFVGGPGTASLGQLVYGLAVSTTLQSGAYAIVERGGVVSGMTLLNDGSVLVSAGGSAFGIVATNAALTVDGFASGTVVNSGGFFVVYGRAVGTILSSGGSGGCEGGATGSGAIVSQGGAWYVADGGFSRGATVLSGGRVLIAAHGQPSISIGDKVSAGGAELVSRGGIASATTVSSGGAIRVSSAGTAIRVHVQSGGLDTVFTSGVASGTVIADAIEYDYGSTVGAVVHAGGHEQVEVFATASGTQISSGGHELVLSGGTVDGASTYNRGELVVASGGAVVGGLTIHAGSATIDGRMASGQTVSFVGTYGTLKLNNLARFDAAISGFHGATQKIDLGGFAFTTSETVDWSQAGASGTLTVDDGTSTASLTLIGAYTTSDFQLSTDNRGGTLIRDPIGGDAVPATARFVQAAAGVEGGRSAAGLAGVHSGGSALLGALPLVTVATSGR